MTGIQNSVIEIQRLTTLESWFQLRGTVNQGWQSESASGICTFLGSKIRIRIRRSEVIKYGFMTKQG